MSIAQRAAEEAALEARMSIITSWYEAQKLEFTVLPVTAALAGAQYLATTSLAQLKVRPLPPPITYLQP